MTTAPWQDIPHGVNSLPSSKPCGWDKGLVEVQKKETLAGKKWVENELAV